MESSECIETIEKKVCVEAEIRVKPEAETGEVEIKCVGEPRREPCEGTLCPECDFTISQMMCIKIPIKFDVDADVVKTGIVCEHKKKECKPHPCDDIREHEEFMFLKDYEESKPGRSFARNYRLTYQNNRDPK